MTIKLYDDQDELIERVAARMRGGCKSVLMQASTGSGKSIMASELLRRARAKNKNVWFSVPRRDLLRQMTKTFRDFDIPHSYIASGESYNPHAHAHICSTDTLKGRMDKLIAPSLAIIDECFPNYHKVDGKNISDYMVGDEINSFNHKTKKTEIRRIKAISKLTISSDMCRIKLSNSTVLDSTYRHPYYVIDSGYTEAIKLKEGDYVLCLHHMPIKNRSPYQWPKGEIQNSRTNLLFFGMLKFISGKTIKRAHEKKKSYDEKGCSGQGVSHPKSNRTQTSNSRRKWKTMYEAPGILAGSIGQWLGTRIFNSDQRGTLQWRISKSLQDRHCKSNAEDSYRNRRQESSYKIGKNSGHQKESYFTKVRVESVEVFQPRSDERYSKMSGDGYIYNFQIDKNENYFCENILVHNCHFGGAGLDRVIKWLKANGTWIIGLSATPWKMSGQGLGCWFDAMECGPSVRWLIDNKRLSEYRAFLSPRLDLSRISMSAGDYAKGELSSFMEANNVIIGNAVAHYKQHAMGRRNIAYCTSIKHSEITAQAFNDAGIPAAHIDGETPDAEKLRIIEAYARREIKVLTNCELLTFGFDLASWLRPHVMADIKDGATIESMSDLRPTKSLALQRQKNGRVMRMKDEPALIFDHASNISEHGMPCWEFPWTLEDRETSTRKAGARAVPVKQCPKCFYVHAPHLDRCPSCGHIHEVKSREVEEIEGQLIEARIEQEKKEKRMEIGKAKTLEDLRRIKTERGYQDAWVYKMAKIKNITE